MSGVMRLPAGGRVDRRVELSFTFGGATYTGHPGDTLASALLANDVHQVATSIRLGRPRGIMAAGPEDPNALVQIEAPFPEPMLTATTVELYDGLVATGLPGQGRLATEPDPARYDAMNVHCEVLVVGAGPAGLSAALTAARSGVRVVLLDDQPEAGGSLLGTAERIDGRPALEWVAAAVAELASFPEVRVLQRTTAFGFYDDGFVLALERRTDHLGLAAPAHLSRQRVWRLRARQVVVATGAHERPVVFADNDRPGIMLAASARTYLHRYGVRCGRRAVVFTTNDSAYAAAVDLSDAGVEVAAVVDARAQAPVRWARECERRGIEVRTRQVVTGTSGASRVSRAHVAELVDGRLGDRTGIGCDLLLISGGWNPAVHLYSQARGRLSYDDSIGAFLPGTDVDGVGVAGSARGRFTLGECLRDGAAVARSALSACGLDVPEPVTPVTEDAQAGPSLTLWSVPDPAEQDCGSTQFVDLQRDASVTDILRATGAGLRSVEHVKRYTTIGTAHDQGKTSGIISSGIVADALGVRIADLGTTTFRPPYTPVSFAALAGRDRGHLHDPERVTPLHEWHVRAGARFEDVGQWKRPWFFPRPGEDQQAAVLRECRAARQSVAMMDASTLGKIEVEGADAGRLLDLFYTNLISTLKVGAIRYGVMCGVDGMAIDDGTVMRLAEDRFLLTTTTGNAATILDWMEEWLQTEWPHLSVRLTSVTEQWATVALVGPRSRDVLARVAPELAVDNDAFPFMTWRDGVVAGLRARVCRISFSGELAFEVNVSGWDGLALWEALLVAGADLDITPYGTETMHVLRAEKGYPIIGQDTDGTVTPHDLGMAWVVSRKKADFIGKRSFARAVNQRPDRKHLVALLPVERDVLLPEGAQLVGSPQLPEPPVPMLGHVTSSYRSAALDGTFALALVKAGRERVGETLYAPVDGRLVAVTVAEPVLYDPEGARRDG
jgi:sarcosine oxidase, subunit alpha